MGGTGLLAVNSLVGRLEPKGKFGDPLGRWSCMSFRRSRLPPITIISVYQVCLKPTNLLGGTAWHQQQRALALASRPESPRQAFISDLTKFIQSLQDNRHEIIVGGDWNDSITRSNSPLLTVCSTLNLVDPWIQHHPQHLDFPTYFRGSDRIDSVFMSRSLIPGVRNISYTPIGLLHPSDHRGILLDISDEVLFGSRPDPLLPHTARCVRSKDRSSVTTFIETMHAHLLAHNAFNRTARLLSPTASPDYALAENLDILIGEAGAVGESRCRRRRSPWFSRPLVRRRLELSCLRRLCDGFRFGHDRRSVLSLRLQMLDSDLELPSTYNAASLLLQEKENAFRQLVSTSNILRRTELSAAADHHESSHQRARAQVLRKINRHEMSQETWRTLAFLSNDATTSKLDRLEIPASWPPMLPSSSSSASSTFEDPKLAVEWRTVTDPTEIEYYLMVRNRMHFGQAQGTPFTINPLAQQFDWTASTPYADDVLHGIYVAPSDVDSLCQTVLHHCKSPTTLDSVPAPLSLASFSGKIRKWREATSTSPSGRHLGWYKSLFARGNHDPTLDPEAHATFQTKQSSIAQLIVDLINFCIDHGYVLERWKQIVNTMIFKDMGDYRIHRLRVIHIYEADFNLLLAVKWRELLHHADRLHLINDGQYGGRHGREASSLALLEELRTDISYATRRTMITFDNDAASCYDRIIPSFASLINRKYGLHRKVAVVHARTLHEAKYKLRTAIGISEMDYSHHATFPLYGTGQGSGNSPAIWLLISATLFDVHSSLARGATFTDQSGTISVRLTLSGFVDDTNSSLNDWQPQSEADLSTLLHLLQQDAQLWNDLLFISGGKLELSKCSFHVLRFEFHPNGTPRPDLTIPSSIHLIDSISGQPIAIPALRANEPHKILGHLKAPAGNQKKQLQAIQKKTKAISRLIATSSLSRYGAKLAYGAKYLAYLRYVLPQCHFSPSKLRQIESTTIPPLIAKCGFFRKTSYSLLFAPVDYAGGGFVHWDTIQGAGQILHFLKHWRTATEISQSLKIDLMWCQWQSGLSQSILVDTHTPVSYFDARWLPSLRTALLTLHSHIAVDSPFVQPIERSGDQYIMEYARSLNLFDDLGLRIINCCRLYLHVTTISELFAADGITLLPHMLECLRPDWFDPELITVLQRRPSKRYRQLYWAKLCSHLLSLPPLGSWVNSRPLRLRRETYFSLDRQLFHWHRGAYWRCHLQDPISHRYSFTAATSWTPTLTSQPCQIKVQTGRALYLLPPMFSAPLPSRPIPATESFESYVALLSDWEQDLMRHIQWHLPPLQVMQFFHSLPLGEPLYLVSDGSSLQSKTMSFGLVVGSATGMILLENMGPAFGTPSSHRAECTGCLSGALVLLHLSRFTGLSFPSHFRTLALSDNLGMITRLKDRASYTTVHPNSTLSADWDLLEEIHQTFLRASLPQHGYQWVRGHQDAKASLTDLGHDALYNIRADLLATRYTRTIDSDLRPSTPLMSSTGCILLTDHISLHSHYRSSLYCAASESSYFSYLATKHHWTDTTRSEVDWVAFRMAARNYHSTDVHLLKLVHDKLPTRAHVARFQPWTNPNCHYCSSADTFDHLMRSDCNSISTIFRDNLLHSVESYFNRNSTPRAFQVAFFGALLGWLHSAPDHEFPVSGWSGPSPLFDSQRTIGWRLLLRGFLSVQWRALLLHELDHAEWTPTTDDNYSFTSSSSQDPDVSTDGADEYPPHLFTAPSDSCTSSSTSSSADVADYQADSLHRTVDPTVFLAGLIKVLWLELSILWRQHHEDIHQSSTQKYSPVTISECQLRIRSLALLRPRVLSRHRDLYFHADLEAFLDRATLPQLESYLARYLPVIMASLREAEIQAAMGASFSSTSRSPSSSHSIHSTSDSSVHPALEEPSHRKRNRLRHSVLPLSDSP
jgi:hypothetical protein